MDKKAVFHLPGLFEFYELYDAFLSLYEVDREYFYEHCEIGSIYGSPEDCLWGGGRVENGERDGRQVLALTERFGISARLTLSNSLLRREHLTDKKCNALCRLFAQGTVRNGAIVHSELLTQYLRETYPELYLVSSTTKVITDFEAFTKELAREEFDYAVADFRLNPQLDKWSALPEELKSKTELLVNECCFFECRERRKCYEDVSRKNLGERGPEHHCSAPGAVRGYRFSAAMRNPGFIGTEDIVNKYLPMGITNFKIEGRGLGSAIVFEMLLYYLVKPEYRINVRELIYLDSNLDLF